MHLEFEDQSIVECDVLLGCDGISSASHNMWVVRCLGGRKSILAVALL
jgi:hypothetical protein